MTKKITYEEALSASTEYFDGDEFAAKVFLDKYALKDHIEGKLLEKTPEDMHKRLAKEFAKVERKKFKDTSTKPYTEKEIFSFFDHFKKILPGGSPMSGIGNPYQIMSLSNCFVINSPDDSYGGIMKADEELVQISKRRGGVGLDISNLRPQGALTNNAAKTSTGIIPFMSRFSNTIREVAQNGRRGAEMISIDIHHPESVIPWDDNVDGEPFTTKIEDKEIGSFEISSRHYNPNKIDFATAKYDKTKVTGANISLRLTDEFLNAVKNNKNFEQRWPVNATNPKISKQTNARDVWDKIIHSAWQCAEPGLLFWDNIIKESPSDCYAENGFQTLSTNPCFSGDTLIAVADGRNAVSIRELAQLDTDVPVYSVNPSTGIISIKWGRNPRKTGMNRTIVRVHLDNGNYLDITPNHKFPLRGGKTKEAKDLKAGDSLLRFNKRPEKVIKSSKKEYYRIYCNCLNSKLNKIFEHRLIAEFINPNQWNDIYDKNKKNGWTTGGLVVHHKDYNGLHNNPENLEIMTFKEHQKYHANKDNSGENNGRYSGCSNTKLEQYAIKLTKKLNRRFSKKDWLRFAGKNNIPKAIAEFRKNGWFNSIKELSIWAANKCNIENVNEDPRVVKTYNSMLKQGYVAKIKNGKVMVQKKCEYSGDLFWVNHLNRNISFSSLQNALAYRNKDKDFQNKRINKTLKTYERQSDAKKDDQIRIFSQLKFDNNSVPSLKEWEQACKKENVPYRLNTKYGFKNYKKIKEAAETYNHKVVKIEYLKEKQDVYNITVDDNHTVGIINKISQNKNGNSIFDGIFTFQCGELPLSKYDSCRLLSLNLLGFVKKAFTEDAYFDFEDFGNYCQIAQRLMDDLVDLEIESVNKIIDKINKDPEENDIKRRELMLWHKVLEACSNGRRTGTGVTALGDTLAALGLKYGSPESITMSTEIYKALKLNCYRSSVDLAKALAPFSVWDFKKEKDNPFLLRIKEEDAVLYEDMKKYGRRNISLLTTPPAGSISILSQTSSGIEPIFMLSYERKKKVNPNDKNVVVESIDENGDAWQSFIIYHPQVKVWKKITKESDLTKSPWHGACANDLEWTQRVKLQASIQKHVDNSISSTINLPKDATVEQVAEIYETAWKLGCKGITIYREGCRQGVMTKIEDKNPQQSFSQSVSNAVKRPKSLKCKVHHIKVTKTLDKLRTFDYLVIVGLMDEKPYEVFVMENGSLPKKYEEGIITKKKRGVYTVSFDDETTIENVIANTTEAEDSLTRLTSIALRHGVDMAYIVQQLQKAQGDLWSFSKAVARALKTYIKEGTTMTGVSCPQCQSERMIMTGGCPICQDCGYTKCN